MGDRRHGLARAAAVRRRERSINSDIIAETFAAAGAYVMAGACSTAARSRGVFDVAEQRIGPDAVREDRRQV
jgi:hypothetical protein